MRKRTVLDLLLLALVSLAGGALFRFRFAGRGEPVSPEPSPPLRAQEFLRTLERSEPVLSPPLASPPPLVPPPPPPLAPSLALLVVEVDGGPGGLREEVSLVESGGAFRVPVRDGRLVLQVRPGELDLHVEDARGRRSPSQRVQLAPEHLATLRFALSPARDPGFRLRMVDSFAEVVSVLSGGSAEAAGLRPGDVVTHMAGRPLSGLGEEDVQSILFGGEGETLSLRVVISNEGGELEVHDLQLDFR